MPLTTQAVALGLIAMTSPAPAPVGQPAADSALGAQVAAITQGLAGETGVCAIHVQTGWRFCHHGDDGFGAASTHKVPIAIQFLRRAEAEGLDLKALHPLGAGDMRLYGPLANLFPEGEVSISWWRLLHLMITVSDNSAAEAILKRAGGPLSVMEMLGQLHIQGMRVDRTFLEFSYDIYGLGPAPIDGQLTLAQLQQLRASTPEAVAQAADKAFGLDPRCRTTPRAMAQLLREVVVRAPTEAPMRLLWDIMLQTPKARLSSMLPAGTRAARKTGTNMPHAFNDIGIVDLPDGRGQLVMAIYLANVGPEEQPELTIGHIARAIFDYVLFAVR